MNSQLKHGVLMPRKQQHAPARVVNARSKRKAAAPKIRLDKLMRSANPKICVKRRLGGIGDVIMTTPLLKAIKTLIPHCHLVYATDVHYHEGALGYVIKHNPYVDELIHITDVREAEYSYSVDVTRTGLNKEKAGTIPPNRIDMFAEEAGVDISADPVPAYVVTEEEKVWADKFLKDTVGEISKDTKIIAIQVRSNDARRTWPLNYVSELIELLARQKNFHVLVFDWGACASCWEKHQADNIHLVIDKVLPETASIIEKSDVVICPDSAILHLAGALRKKIVTIFGPIPPESRINHYANATAVVKRLPCSFCWYSPRCNRSSGHSLECLTSITPKEVFDAVNKKLAEDYIYDMTNITYGKELTDSNQDPVILVRRTTNGLGDILMTTPAIEALSRKHPNKKIEVACPRKVWPALENNPYISKLVDCDDNINYKRYYATIDISFPCARYESARVSMGKPVQKSRVEIFAEAMEVRNDIKSLKPIYVVTEEEEAWADNFLKQTTDGHKPKIAIALRSAEIYRDWPEEYYEKLFSMASKNFDLILLDHSRDACYSNVVDAAGFDLRKTIAILSKCDGLITVDTGFLHYGAALDIPTVVMFGPIDYKARCKGYDNVTVVKSDMSCSPCWRNGSTKCKVTGLVKSYSECLKKISPSNVLNIAKQKFK